MYGTIYSVSLDRVNLSKTLRNQWMTNLVTKQVMKNEKFNNFIDSFEATTTSIKDRLLTIGQQTV